MPGQKALAPEPKFTPPTSTGPFGACIAKQKHSMSLPCACHQSRGRCSRAIQPVPHVSSTQCKYATPQPSSCGTIIACTAALVSYYHLARTCERFSSLPAAPGKGMEPHVSYKHPAAGIHASYREEQAASCLFLGRACAAHIAFVTFRAVKITMGHTVAMLCLGPGESISDAIFVRHCTAPYSSARIAERSRAVPTKGFAACPRHQNCCRGGRACHCHVCAHTAPSAGIMSFVAMSKANIFR